MRIVEIKRAIRDSIAMAQEQDTRMATVLVDAGTVLSPLRRDNMRLLMFFGALASYMRSGDAELAQLIVEFAEASRATANAGAD